MHSPIIKQVPPARTRLPDNVLEAYLVGLPTDGPIPRWIGYAIRVEGERETPSGAEVNRIDWAFESLDPDGPSGGGFSSRAEAIDLLIADVTGVRTFKSTGDAYDASQCDESIGTGSILDIPSEGVIGVAYAWPVAVTAHTGALHGYAPTGPGAPLPSDWPVALRAGIVRAVKLARERGLTIADGFAHL